MSDRHARPPVDCWLSDMDGVLVREESAIPGAAEFVKTLQEHGRRFLLLTNNSIFTARDLRARLRASGIDVPEEAIGPPRWRPPNSWPTRVRAVRRS
jgi:NagD protein